MPCITLSDRVIGARIREARQRKGIHQSELGAEVGVHGTTVGQWERGEIALAEGRIFPVAEALGIEPARLFPLDVVEVTADERDLLEAYRRIGLNSTGKASVHRIMAAIEIGREAASC
nr:helix-turn-helix domain-containing protein [Methylobacterium sp. OTU13CASTA1]